MAGEKKTLRFAVIGTGFWSNFQIAAWKELDGAIPVALYNRTLSRAEECGRKFGVESVYDDVDLMLEETRPDFVDIITDVDTHFKFASIAAARGIDVVCQKPMAVSLEQAAQMLHICDTAR